MSTKQATLKVGCLVEHPGRPQWGPGIVVATGEGRSHVFFRDNLEPAAKVILTEFVELKMCEQQEDEMLSGLPAAKFDGQHWMLPKAKVSKKKAKLPGAK